MRKVLVLGRYAEIVNTIVRLIDQWEGFTAVASSTVDEMIGCLHAEPYVVLLVGAGFSTEQEKEIREKAKEIRPEIKIIEHFGGGSGLLLSELKLL